MDDPTTALFNDQREARILITPACNYRCVFCHREGITDTPSTRWRPSEEETIKLIDQVLVAGGRDITLSGGEPLIHKDLVAKVVGHVAVSCPEATVTIVSNASLIESEWLANLARHGNVRMNISLHTCAPEMYARITAQNRFSVEQIGEKLDLLQAHGVPFKLNCVAMRDTTATREQVQSLCEFAASYGALALKFIELLVLEQSEHLFPQYLSSDSIRELLPAGATLRTSGPRRDEYLISEYEDLVVELQKCRCRFGCRKCLVNSTVCFNSQGILWPCFEFSERSFDLRTTGFKEAMDQGRTMLEKLAETYGDGSPSLIKDLQFRERKREAYFHVHGDDVVEQLRNNATKTESFSFSEWYLRMDGEDAGSSEEVKIRRHDGDPENARLIVSTRFREFEDELPVTSTVFLDAKRVPITGALPFVLNTMARLRWHPYFECRLEGDWFVTPGATSFSVAVANGGVCIVCVGLGTQENLALAQRLSQHAGVTPIGKPLHAFLRSACSDQSGATQGPLPTRLCV